MSDITMWKKIHDVADEVAAELSHAMEKYGPQSSAHEGFAVLKEEVDEVWDVVKLKQSTPDRIPALRKELIQVAAMAIRTIIDVCDRNNTK